MDSDQGSQSVWMMLTIGSLASYSFANIVIKVSDKLGTVPTAQKTLLGVFGQTLFALVMNANLGIKDFTGMPFAPVPLLIGIGVANCMGNFFMTKAVDAGGDLSAIVMISGLYPAVVFIFSALAFGEKVTAYKLAGVGCALASGFFFAQ
mmetsp:Transcript_147378/g.268614  ORF Transcript_147378/g.268614 Transcript_147378/m.268614 type:complete len:149 (+) Transcript_147378:79-525(+)